MSRLYRIAVVITLAAVAALLMPMSASTAVTPQVERYHFDFGTQVAEDPCTGEAVVWTGGYDVVIATTETRAGVVRSLNYSMQLNGTGLESGEDYVLNAHYHQIVREGILGPDVFVMPDTTAQVSTGEGSNYQAHTVQVYVVASNGEPIIDMERSFVRCLG
jgi:hypothetical protein